MKKILLALMIICSFFLVGCSNKNERTNNTNNDTSGNTNSQTQQDKNEYTLYKDSKPISFDDTSLSITSCYDYGFDNYSLTVAFSITNNTLKEKEYKFKDISLTKEVTGVKYTVNNVDTIKLEPELKESFTFRSIIPSSIDNDKYILKFTINKTKIIFNMYDTPDELKEVRNINYYVNGKLVHNEQIIDGKVLNVSYIYESDDYTSYCNEWYIDSYMHTRTGSSVTITEDKNFYGKIKSTVYMITTSSDNYSYVNKIDYVPTSKIIVIPDTYLGKELFIQGYAIHGFIGGKVYVPKTVRLIYSGNFVDIGSNTVIYYEGTQDEWNALFYTPSDASKITNTIVFNANKGML